MGIMNPVHATSYSRGFTYKPVTVVGIDANGNALCDDSTGNLHTVPVGVSRAKGTLPQVGEQWLITQDLGIWTFAAIINYAPNQGTATMLSGHTTVAVTFTTAEPDANYGVLLTGSYSASFWFTSRTQSGFTINSSSAPGSNSPVTWKLVR